MEGLWAGHTQVQIAAPLLTGFGILCRLCCVTRMNIKAPNHVLLFFIYDKIGRFSNGWAASSPFGPCTQGLLAKQPSLSKGPGMVPVYPWMLVQVLCKLSNYSNQPSYIFPWEPGFTPPSWYYKGHLPIAPVGRLLQTCVALPRVPGPPPQAVNICGKWTAVNLICSLSGGLCSAIPTTPGQESLPHQQGQQEVAKI